VFSTKTGAAKLLIGTVIGLVVLKLVVGWLTGSISVLAQAADSLMDILAGVVTFSAIRIAANPADKEHPYGHGKVEDIAGALQGILIAIAAGLIIYSSVRRIIAGTSVESAETGIAVMAVSIVVSIFLSRHLLKVARATASVALEANAHNIAADIYSALAVLVAMVAVKLTGYSVIDPIIAIGVAIYLLKIALNTVRKPLSGLIDAKLPHSQETAIKVCLAKHSQYVLGYHALRTRRSGSQHYIDLHLVMNKDVSLQQAHDVCDMIEMEIDSSLPGANVTIHVEPTGPE